MTDGICCNKAVLSLPEISLTFSVPDVFVSKIVESTQMFPLTVSVVKDTGFCSQLAIDK